MVGGAGSVAVGRGLSAVFLREPVVLRLLDLVLIGLDEVVGVVGRVRLIPTIVALVELVTVLLVLVGVVSEVDMIFFFQRGVWWDFVELCQDTKT